MMLTGTAETLGNSLIGFGTLFLSEVVKGDVLYYSGKTIKVLEVISDTELLTDAEQGPREQIACLMK